LRVLEHAETMMMMMMVIMLGAFALNHSLLIFSDIDSITIHAYYWMSS